MVLVRRAATRRADGPTRPPGFGRSPYASVLRVALVCHMRTGLRTWIVAGVLVGVDAKIADWPLTGRASSLALGGRTFTIGAAPA